MVLPRKIPISGLDLLERVRTFKIVYTIIGISVHIPEGKTRRPPRVINGRRSLYYSRAQRAQEERIRRVLKVGLIFLVEDYGRKCGLQQLLQALLCALGYHAAQQPCGRAAAHRARHTAQCVVQSRYFGSNAARAALAQCADAAKKILKRALARADERRIVLRRLGAVALVQLLRKGVASGGSAKCCGARGPAHGCSRSCRQPRRSECPAAERAGKNTRSHVRECCAQGIECPEHRALLLCFLLYEL